MGEISWTSEPNGTFYVYTVTPTTVYATGTQITVTLPSISLRANDWYYTNNKYCGLGCYYMNSQWYYNNEIQLKNGNTVLRSLSAYTSTTVANNTWATAYWNNTPSIATSSLFTSSNNTTRTVALKLYLPSGSSGYYHNNSGGPRFPTSTAYELATVNVTLDYPPTATLGTPTYATPQYAGLGAYTVPITSAEAYYGGDISKVTLTVGQDSTVQTYSTSSISNETISVTPTVAGTYTPTITIEDSRGQTTTNTLSQIVVNPYLNPSLGFDVVRTNNNGVRADEGAYGLIMANVSFIDEIADIRKPTVQINGITTNNVMWYSAYNVSTGVSSSISNWSTVSSGDTIYGLINGSFAQTNSYQITVMLTDSLGGNSSAITQTLSTAFYTIDFQAGGKEIAFGGPANDSLVEHPNGLFKCNMDAWFNGSVIGISGSLVGEIKAYAGVTVPSGWLECDGSEVAIADYPLLYDAIQNLWGTPSDNNHFILPNMKGKVPVGYDGNDTDFSTVGNNGGTKDAVIPYHRHSVSAVNNAITGGSHCHKLPGNDKTVASGSSYARPRSDGAGTANMYYTTYDTHTHNLPAHNTDYIGTDGNAVGANLQPYAVVKYIICTGE